MRTNVENKIGRRTYGRLRLFILGLGPELPFAPFLCSCSTDTNIRIFNGFGEHMRLPLRRHGHRVVCMCLLPPFRLVTVGKDNLVRLWDLLDCNSKIIYKYTRGKDRADWVVSYTHILDNQSYIYMGGGSLFVIYSLATATSRIVINTLSLLQPILIPQILPQHIFLASTSTLLYLYHPFTLNSTPLDLPIISNQLPDVITLLLSITSLIICICGKIDFYSIYICDHELQIIAMKENILSAYPNSALVIYKDSKSPFKLIIGTEDGFIHIYLIHPQLLTIPNSPTCKIKAHSTGITSIIRISEQIIATSSKNRTIKFWDLRDGECVHTVIAHDKAVTQLLRFWN